MAEPIPTTQPSSDRLQVEIDARGRAEQREREIQERLDLALASGGLGIWEVDLAAEMDHPIVLSETCRTHFGIAPHIPVSRQTLYAALHPDERDRVNRAAQRTLEDRTDFELEYRVVWPDETTHWLSARGRLAQPPSGEAPRRLIGITQDVTAFRAAERLQRQKDAELRTVLASAPVIFWAADASGTITHAMGNGASLMGIALDSVVGRSLFEMYHAYPHVIERIQEAYSGLSAAYQIHIGEYSTRTELRTQWSESGAVIGITGVRYDISDRVRAENALQVEHEELRRSEFRLREAQETAHVGSWDVDLVTGHREWSEEMYRIYGLNPSEGPPEEAYLKSFHHPDDRPRYEQSMRTILETGRSDEFDIRVLIRNNEQRWLHLKAKPLLDENRRVFRIAGTAADITERVRSEERFRTIFESSSDAILLLGRYENALILDCNAAAVTLFETRDKSGLIGHHPREFSPERQPDGRLSSLPHNEVKSILEGGSVRFEWIHRALSGVEIPTEVILTSVTLNGEPEVLSVIRDLTERKKAERALREADEQLRLAVEAAELGAWTVDIRSGDFKSISPRTKHLFGVSAEADFTWADCQRAVHTEDRGAVRAAVHRIIETGTSGRIDHRIVWPDESVHWLTTHAGAYLEDGDSPTRIIGVSYDITERKELERQREELLAIAQDRADHDPLTGLLNHRVFHIELSEALASALRDDSTVAIVLLDIDNFRYFNEVYGHIYGDEVLRVVAQRLIELYDQQARIARYAGDQFALAFPNPGQGITPSALEARVRADLARLSFQPASASVAIPISASVGASVFAAKQPISNKQEDDVSTVLERADRRLQRAKTGADIDDASSRLRILTQERVEGFSMLDALVAAVDNKDRYTRRHSEDVMQYSVMIAESLGLDDAARETIAVAALLHDVGKIGIPDSVLRKPGGLSESDIIAVRKHPSMGAIMVAAVPGLEGTLDAIRHHHERWDGGGYPSGLQGQEIPLIARIMAVADAFSAMTTSRPYREAMRREAALSILKAGAGAQWDPDCVHAFLTALSSAG